MIKNEIKWDFPFRSRRSPVLAKQVVATSQPLAAQAGIEIMRQGGNAVDAAIATAAVLTVCEPTMNGLGSDAFAIIWDGKQLHGLNGSGKSPEGWTYEHFQKLKKMPTEGWNSVTVPGVISAWVALSKKYGVLPFKTLLNPAIQYAEKGFLVSPIIARQWKDGTTRLSEQPGFKECFMPNGNPPSVGEEFSSPDQASSLKLIAETEGESFYRGEIAHTIATASNAQGGFLNYRDLKNHKSEWVKPIALDYRGYQINELPPNGQGIASLLALGILEHFEISGMEEDSPELLHLQIEAMKIALKDTYRSVADADFMKTSPEKMLAANRLQDFALNIKSNEASPVSKFTVGSETVYLTTADSEGMMVSFIQSNFFGFGSGIVVPGTGISMQNRGAGFNLSKGHPNSVGPNKRPFHTIIPGFVLKDNEPFLSFGVMGGDMQAQGHLQILSRILDFSNNVQAAIDAPRWKINSEGTIQIEENLPKTTIDGLRKLGHRIEVLPYGHFDFGAAQLIQKIKNGYIAGSEPRRDGCAVGY